MDPNEALNKLRWLLNVSEDDPLCNAADVIETFKGLDAWLTKGGFLPRAWGIRGSVCEHEGSAQCPKA